MFDASQIAFANLSGSRATASGEARLFRRYGAERPECMDRTRWHLLLPLNQAEDLGGEIRIYTLDKLQAIGAATETLFSAQEAKGAAAKGLPVSYMHAIELRLQGSEPAGANLERAGTICGVHVCDGAGPYQGGLWACIEWTPKAWAQIDCGEWLDLSIALASDYVLADGSRIAGECMFAAALVDVGFFEAIPGARDGLPPEAFAAGPSVESIAVYRRGFARRLFAKGENMEPEIKPSVDGVSLAFDESQIAQMRDLLGELLAPHAERLGELAAKLDKVLEMQAQDLALEAGEEAEEAAEEAGEMEAEGEAPEALAMAPKAATAPVTMAKAAEDMASRVAAKVAPLGEAKIAQIVQGHVESGALLPAHVRAYALSLAKGDTVGAAGLLGDYAGVSVRSGSSLAAPAAKAPTLAAKITASDIIADIEKEGRHRKGTQAFVSEMYSRIDKARAAGRLS